jgi:hypothetical protein
MRIALMIVCLLLFYAFVSEPNSDLNWFGVRCESGIRYYSNPVRLGVIDEILFCKEEGR